MPLELNKIVTLHWSIYYMVDFSLNFQVDKSFFLLGPVSTFSPFEMASGEDPDVCRSSQEEDMQRKAGENHADGCWFCISLVKWWTKMLNMTNKSYECYHELKRIFRIMITWNIASICIWFCSLFVSDPLCLPTVTYSDIVMGCDGTVW